MRRKILIIIGLTILLHVYIWLQLISAMNSVNIQICAISFLFFSVIMIFTAMFARFIIHNQRIVDIVSWAGMICMGIFSSLLVLTFIRQILIFVYSWFIPVSHWLNVSSVLWVILLSFGINLIGFFNARALAKVNVIEIAINNLPLALSGFTIVQISDIHVGSTIKRDYLKAIVEKVNALSPDMIAITGDLVDGAVENLSYHVEPLVELSAKYGTFFVLGNHEYYSGADDWIREITRLGIKVLMNEHMIIAHDGALLTIAGVTDFSGHHFGDKHISDPKLAILGAPEDSIKILLAHQPRSALESARYGYHLQLSGHTHGGQFWPWNLFVRLQQPFTAGLGKINNMWVYTNRGTGYWGPPKRFGIASEISCIRLIGAK